MGLDKTTIDFLRDLFSSKNITDLEKLEYYKDQDDRSVTKL